MFVKEKIAVPVETILLSLYSNIRDNDERMFMNEVLDFMVSEPSGRKVLTDWWAKHASP